MEKPSICIAARAESEYARNGRGPEKRYYFSPRTVWDREDWIREMAKPASEGGMSCLELDWETNYSNYVRQCKEVANEELHETRKRSGNERRTKGGDTGKTRGRVPRSLWSLVSPRFDTMWDFSAKNQANGCSPFGNAEIPDLLG